MQCRIDPFASFARQTAIRAIRNEPTRSRAYRPQSQRYQVTDLLWLRCHVHLAVFGHGEDLKTAFWYTLNTCQAPLISSHGSTNSNSIPLRTVKERNWKKDLALEQELNY